MSDASITIRPIRPAEHAPLGELIVRAYRAVPGARSEVHDAYEHELRDVERRTATSCVLVAVGPDDALLGGVTYVAGPDDPYAELLVEGDAAFRMLAVDPAAQGRGAGRALVLACIERARAAGRRRVVLHTTPAMARARRLYEGLGFHREPGLDWQPVPEVGLLGYAFDLIPPPDSGAA